MSDLPTLATESRFSTNSTVASESQFDVSQIERTIRSVNAVERSWRLPPLPETVKLDLATSPEISPDDLTEFLLGLDQDLADQGDDLPSEELPVITPVQANPQTGGSEASRLFSRYISDLSGHDRPTELDADAVQQFKISAVERGLLDPPVDGQVDSTWSPELRSLQREMAWDDTNDQRAGNRAGAMPLGGENGALELIADWTQPAGLLAAATELDLFWDFGNIEREFSTWGDKWRKVGESSNPFDFGKNLIDAVTGPIDDVVFPAVNLALLGTGLGAVANGARIVSAGSKVGTLGRIYSGASRVARPLSATKIAEPSWTATRLLARNPDSVVGGAMAGWRALPAVARTKQAVGVGMRTGFLSQAEDVFPGYQGGEDLSFGPVAEGAEDLRQFGMGLPSLPLELALAPYNIFNPGTFFRSAAPEGAGLLSNAGRGFLAAGGTLPGRAAVGGVAGAGVGALTGDDAGDVVENLTIGALGAAVLPHLARGVNRGPAALRSGIGGGVLGAGVAAVTDYDTSDSVMLGAVSGASIIPAQSIWSNIPNPGKWVGYASDILSKTSYRTLAEDQHLTAAFDRGVRRLIVGEGPEALQRWDDAFNKNDSFIGAYREFFGHIDDESAAAELSWVALSAAIDYTAHAQARFTADGDFHLFRNKLIAQLRTFDLSTDSTFLMEDVARAMSIDKIGTPNYVSRYRDTLSNLTPQRAMEFARQHNETAEQTLRQLLSSENIPDLAHVGGWSDIDSAERIGVIEAYIGQAYPSMGRWSEFNAQATQIQHWVNGGILDDARFLDVPTPTGHVRQPKAGLHRIAPKTINADDAIVDTLIREPEAARKAGSKMLAPLARVQPTGRFTMARVGTRTKQDYEGLALELRHTLNAAKRFEKLRASGVQQTLAAEGLSLTGVSKNELDRVLRTNKFGRSISQAKYIRRFLLDNGLSEGEISAHLSSKLDEWANNSDFWADWGLEPILRGETNLPLTGRAAVEARIKEINRKARFTAAEIDAADAVAGVRARSGDGAADALQAEFDVMTERGYKLVHGVEFLAPHDLALNTELFRDIGTREKNFQTFGNFFGRRHPAVARAAQERRERMAMTAALSDLGSDFSVSDDKISLALSDLKTILLEQQDDVARRVEEMHLMGFTERKRTAIESAFTPLRIEDLTVRQPKVLDRLTARGWSEDEADAIFSAVRKMRNTEFQDLGLYSFEAKLRSRNELVSALKWIGGSDTALSSQRAGAVAGAVGGVAAADGASGPDGGSVAERVAGGLVGAAAGVGTATAVGRGLHATDWLGNAIRAAEQRPRWMLADKLVWLRDGMRFSLSPFFDVSRWTEGAVLSQTAVPLRHPETGKRIALPVNMTPGAVQKRLGRASFDAAKQEFRKLSKTNGHGEVEILDDAGHWFQQVGIMGFNPQAWQAGAFAELKRAGVDAETAYQAARATHTYGTAGRSAAELSVNFVFFPFSFQKKALTHIAKWMNDDLARSLIIHDGYATYQALQENFGFDEWVDDHVPGLYKLNQLNLFGYGISPGRLGGINAQTFEFLGSHEAIQPAAALFGPVGVNIQTESDFLDLKELMESFFPVYNDINWMTENIKSTGDVISSPTHQLRYAQVRDGYAEWDTFRQEQSDWLAEQGLSWSDLHRKPFLADRKMAYEVKKAELAMKYPAWQESRNESIFNAQMLENEKNNLFALVEADVPNRPQQADLMYQYQAEVDSVITNLGYLGVTLSPGEGWADAPPEATNYLKDLAVRMAAEFPQFRAVYAKHFEHDLGPIETPTT